MMMKDIGPIVVMIIGYGLVGLMGVGLFRFMKSRYKKVSYNNKIKELEERIVKLENKK